MKSTARRRLTTMVVVGALSLGVASAAWGTDNVTQSVTGGTRTASIADLALPGVSYSHSNQTNSGTMVLTVDDSSATGDGWNVTVQAGNFVYSGDNAGTDIPAANFALTAAATPVSTAGQTIDVTGGPKVPSVSPVGALDTARKVIQADVGYGQGTYTQDLSVDLTVPGQSRAGTYTGTLTTTITAAP